VTDSQTQLRELYLDLLKRSLTGALAEDNDTILGGARSVGTGGLGISSARGTASVLAKRAAHTVGKAARRFNVEIAYKRAFDPKQREVGGDWPSRAESMIGLKRMDNIQRCIESIIADGVEGDLIETGVWRGGATIFMRGVLKAYDDASRTVWAADSFEGLPKPNATAYAADEGDTHFRWSGLAVGVDQVRHNFERYGLLDEQVQFLVGWFKDTLPTAPIEKLSLIRLDGDMYESTIQAIEALYPKLSSGGFCIIDDFGSHVSQAQAAVHDYRKTHGITEPIVDIDGSGAFWRKA
jgi:O-methyltransferase